VSRLILLRHAHPDGHERRCIGHHDTELSTDGRGAVAKLADACVANRREVPRRIITSDLARARATSEAFAVAWDAELDADPRLREMHFGSWEGRTWDEINAHDTDAMRRWADDWINVGPPGGESGLDFAAGVSCALGPIVAEMRRERRDVLVVAHAGVIRVAATLLLGEPLGAAFDRSIDYLRAGIFDASATGVRLLAWDADISSE